MSVRIHGAEHPLKEIFSDDFVFQVPPYQRPYSWTPEHAGELIDDLLSALANGNEEEHDPYFLGSIVLAKEEHNPSAQIIDGQQRLTTLTILFASLAALADSEERDELSEFILQKGSKLKQTSTVFRVTLRPRDAGFFRQYIQEPNGVSELLERDAGQLSDPAKNVQANAALFMERLRALTSSHRSALAQYLLNDCFLVAVSTPDTESAFKIFTVLNDRGLDLSHADIIKSELIGKIPDNDQERYTEIWETAEEDLGIEAFADLFAHIRMIFAKAKQRGALIKEFRDHVVSSIHDPRDFIDDVVSPYADVYARIVTQSWESSSNAERINEILGWLKRIDNVDWVPPAIRYLNAHEQDSELVYRFLQKLERLAATMLVRRVNVNGRIERYASVLKELEADVALLEHESALEVTDEEKRETIDQLDGPLYLETRTRSYVLLRLDEALSAGGARYDHQLITVEHVLPQAPAKASTWKAWFSDAERDYWVHRLANLVLLPRRRNSAAQNYDFDRKKDKYFSDEHGTSPFAITTQVLKNETWSPDVLEQRQARLLSKLRDVWGLHV